MNKIQLIDYWKEQGEKWLKGGISIEGWELGGDPIELTEKQKEFINNKSRYCLSCGSYRSGKTKTSLMKIGLMCLFFPGNRILVGRKTLTELETVTMPDFCDLWPGGWYNWEKGKRTITWFNGSQILLFGLDALQEGSEQDIKKAVQTIKGLNLGGFFIDQLEEIEYKVFEALTGRLSRAVPFHQAVMTINPADHWSYNYFKEEPREDTKLVEEMSMLEVLEILKKRDLRIGNNKVIYESFDRFVKDQLKKPKEYVKRYVKGIWNPAGWQKGQVFEQTYIETQNKIAREPEYEWEGAKVFFDPEEGHEYQIGIDPSEGEVDPCGIIISDIGTGEVVLSYSDFIPSHEVSRKSDLFGRRYYDAIAYPEKTGAGLAVLEALINKGYPNICTTEVFDTRDKKVTEKLGWITNVRTKRLLISYFRKLLQDGWPKLNDKRIISEMNHFIWTDEAKKKGASATQGYHDDKLMAAMLAFYGQEAKLSNPGNPPKKEDNLIQPISANYK